MSKSPYQKPRPSIRAEVERLIFVEAGHTCAVKECPEHTYLELHHIDENRENNDPANLIALCDKHHKMAHAGIIDRKALRLYKTRLSTGREADIIERLSRLEAQFDQTRSELPVAESSPNQPTDKGIRKISARRSAVQSFALCQVAITQLEDDLGIYLERHVELAAREKRLILDGLKQFDSDVPDVIVDFCYLRKSYLDGSSYARWVREKLDVYELMTGRKARAVLLAVVGKDEMLEEGALPLIRESVDQDDGITLQVYSCSQLGFHPGPVSAALF